jgi:hypothetical protein
MNIDTNRSMKGLFYGEKYVPPKRRQTLKRLHPRKTYSSSHNSSDNNSHE